MHPEINGDLMVQDMLGFVIHCATAHKPQQKHLTENSKVPSMGVIEMGGGSTQVPCCRDMLPSLGVAVGTHREPACDHMVF